MASTNAQAYIPIPEMYTRRKLNDLYRKIPVQDTTARLLRKYFSAAANLYGVITVRKLYSIVESQNPGMITLEHFGKFAEIACHEPEEYYILDDNDLYGNGRILPILDREILDSSLLNDGGAKYAILKEAQYRKPYYIPEKKRFLSYEEPLYCDSSNAMKEFRAFLSKTFVLSELRMEQVFQELVYQTRFLNASPEQVTGYLQEMGLEFKEEKTLQEFTAAFKIFSSHMRMHCHRGHTPLEIGSIDLLVDPLGKIGRNDPCPCGSGKKYKKCCAK